MSWEMEIWYRTANDEAEEEEPEVRTFDSYETAAAAFVSLMYEEDCVRCVVQTYWNKKPYGTPILTYDNVTF